MKNDNTSTNNNRTAREASFSIRADYNREDGALDIKNVIDVQNCSLEEVQAILCNVILPKLGIFAGFCINVELPNSEKHIS